MIFAGNCFYDETKHLEAIECAYQAAILESDPMLSIKAALRSLVNDSTLPNAVNRFQAAVHGVSLRLHPEYPEVAAELQVVHDYVGLYLQAINNDYQPVFPGSEYIRSTIALWDVIVEEEKRAQLMGITN